MTIRTRGCCDKVTPEDAAGGSAADTTAGSPSVLMRKTHASAHHRARKTCGAKPGDREMIEVKPDEKEVSVVKPEDKMSVVKPEDKEMSVMKPEDKVSVVKPEDKVSVVKPEDKVSVMKPEDKMSVVKPEDKMSVVKPEDKEMSVMKAEATELSGDRPEDRGLGGVKPGDKKLSEEKAEERQMSRIKPDVKGTSGVTPDGRGTSGVTPDGRGTSGVTPDGRGTSGVTPDRHCGQCARQRPPETCRGATPPVTPRSSRWPRTSPAAWLAVVAAATLLQLEPAWARHQAKVHSSRCSYTLVINEFDVSKCPVMQADAQSAKDPRRYRWSDSPDSSSARLHAPFPALDSQDRDQLRLQGAGGSPESEAATGGREVDVLKSQVRDLENRLLEEMVRSRELNSTLARHTAALSRAEEQLTSYTSNFTAIYRAIMFVQRQMQKQRRINKSLNKKLSNVLLDVVEVSNVLTRIPASPQNGGKATTKNFEVQSVAEVRACPGVTDKSITYRDCAAVFAGGHKQSGVYYVKPTTAGCPVPVWCDMDTPPGGWLVFQRRQDGTVGFNRNWAQYRHGFGNVAGEHWLGNDNLFLLSNQDHYQLRVDMWDFSGNRVFASYSTFRVAGERDKYQLTVTGYSGSAQDSLYRHNRMSFSTPDSDNDGRREAHCAAEWEAGWWFNNCWFALLNGAYHNRSDVDYRGIAWNHWKREQLRKTEMKIRPLLKPGKD